MNRKLTGIPETLLIPLWARAVEYSNPNPIVRDEKAVEMVSRIDYDFSKFESARFSQLGVSIRTMLLDDAATAFFKSNPDAVVINLGAGLDTRYERVATQQTTWYEVDLPESIELRRRFCDESERHRFVARSMFDDSWMDQVEDAGRSVLLIAEGLFMYFEEEELSSLCGRLVERFSGAEMLVEVMGPALVGKARKHDSLKKLENAPEFKWGIRDSREMTTWHPGIRFVEEWCYFDYHKDRAGWMGYIIRLPFVRSRIAPRIVHLRFQGNSPDNGCAGKCRREEG